MEYIESLSRDNSHYLNLVVVGAELLVLFILYFLLSRGARFILQPIYTLESLKKFPNRLDAFVNISRFSLRLVFLLLFLTVIGVNGYQVYHGTDLKTFTADWFQTIPADLWSHIAISVAKLGGLIIVARYVIRVIDSTLQQLMKRAVEFKQLHSNDESVSLFFESLKKIQRITVWLLVLYIAANLFRLSETIANYILIGLKVYLIIAIGLLIVTAVAAVVDSLDGLSKRYAETNDLLAFYQQLQHLVPVFRRTLEYIIYVAVATLALTQLTFISSLADYGPGVIQGIGLIFIARVVIEIFNLFIDRTYLHDKLSDADKLRNATIFPIIKNILAAFVYFFITILILRGLGFDPIPLLAGAGILGMVIGLGAQSLVNDMVSGFFIVLDNILRVGDYIAIKDVYGTVESIGLRTIRVRSRDGQLYIVRNGQLDDVINYSRSYTHAVVEVGVDHESDLKQVHTILTKIGEQIEIDNPAVMHKTKIEGIEDFSGPEIVIRTITKVQPGQHEDVERELRSRIKEAFDKEGIVIPFDKRYQLA